MSIAMEGYNGYARPLDQMIRVRNYRLFNINNLKLARFKEIFPGAAKTDALDARKIAFKPIYTPYALDYVTSLKTSVKFGT
ncbi:transposase [Methylobacter sp.]|uniref:IS110 family transposase n=1 Tax=Methylobacter sp. TaxID=2051955 RepID=UPI0025E70C2A|nr:transposase [Methylobacter sp.]